MFGFAWCSDLGVLGWAAMGLAWVTVVGLAVFAVNRMFPRVSRRAGHADGTAAQPAGGEVTADTIIDLVDSR